MVQSIEVFLQPPSPTINTVNNKLPSINTILPTNSNSNQQLLPTIKVDDDDINDDRHSYHSSHSNSSHSNKLKVMEPNFDTSPSISPYQSSPIMTFSSCSPSSSTASSPMILPLSDSNSFLLPPPDSLTFRRNRSLSNVSNNSSTSNVSSTCSIRFLSEPPAFNLSGNENNQQRQKQEEEDEDNDYSPIFGPKRKRGRPPNTCQPKSPDNSNFTFIKPTVWDVKNTQQSIAVNNNNNNDTNNHNTQHSFITNTTPNKKMLDGINTFTTTNMNLALIIPKKKRGRKPKKQLAGNSCFVWKDLTAPRGANKKTLLKQQQQQSP